MSNTWDKAKNGALFAGKLGLAAGAVAGAAFMLLTTPAGIGAALISAAATGAVWGVEAAIAGGVIGGTVGAAEDGYAFLTQSHKKPVTYPDPPPSQAPSADLGNGKFVSLEDTLASDKFQAMVQRSRQQAEAAAQR